MTSPSAAATALGQHDDDQRRHRDWFLEWSERAPTLDQFASYRTASEQNDLIDNLRQALDYSRATGELEALLRQTVAMHGVWFMLRGDEGRSWLAACERAATTDAQRLEHVMVSTAAAFSSEHWEYALELAPELLDLSERVDHPLAVLGLSMCGMMKFDDVDAGLELIERAERRDHRITSGFLPITRHLTGDLYLGSGRYERAVARYEAALADYVDDRFFWWITASLANGGLAAHLSGRSTHGLALVERAHDMTATDSPALGGHSRSVVNLAVIRSALGDIEHASVELLSALDRQASRGRRVDLIAEPIVGVMHLALDAGDADTAACLLGLATQLHFPTRSPWQSALCRSARARLHMTSAGALACALPVDDGLEQARRVLRRCLP